MLAKTFSIMCIISFVCAAVNGRMSELSAAVLSGASRAVDITIGLLGMMCLWCGIMNLLKETGAIEKLARLISPILRLLFPSTHKSKNGIGECAASISANLLGIGNAATPFAISALEKMQTDNPSPDTASDDMITLALINCSPICLMPMTLITLRSAAGSADATRILVPVWICSVFGSILSVIISKIFSKIGKRRKKRR